MRKRPMAQECQICSRCGNPLSDFEKMIAEGLGADKVYCKVCTKKLEDEWTRLSFKDIEDRITPEEKSRYQELDKFFDELIKSGYYGKAPDSTCPQCGRETLERMSEGSFTRSRCVSCGYDDVQDGS